MHRRVKLGTALALAGPLAGCKADRPSAEPETATQTDKAAPAVLTVTAADFSFDAPAKVPAGTTTFRLVNQGKELHQAQLVRLEDGKSLADLAKALQNPGPPPSWLKWVGGPNGIAPGQEANATAVQGRIRHEGSSMKNIKVS